MNMVIPFPQHRPVRARASLARRRKGALPTMLQAVLDWISLHRAIGRSLAELRGMDDRMLRDIGLTRDDVRGLNARPLSDGRWLIDNARPHER